MPDRSRENQRKSPLRVVSRGAWSVSGGRPFETRPGFRRCPNQRDARALAGRRKEIALATKAACMGRIRDHRRRWQVALKWPQDRLCTATTANISWPYVTDTWSCLLNGLDCWRPLTTSGGTWIILFLNQYLSPSYRQRVASPDSTNLKRIEINFW